MLRLIVLALALVALPAAAQPAPTELPVTSSQTLDVERVNTGLAQSENTGQNWVTNPIYVADYAVRALGSAGLVSPFVSILRQDNAAEAPDTTVVTVVLDGFLDDSIRGERYDLVMVPSPRETPLPGSDQLFTWRLASATKAFRCWEGRGESAAFHTDGCS